MVLVKICKVINYNTLIAYLVTHFPECGLLNYDGPESRDYQAILGWCNINTDLRPLGYGNILQTNNGILFDANTKRFVNICDDKGLFVYFDFSSILPKPLCDLVTVDTNETYLLEPVLAETDIETLRELKAVGPTIEIQRNLLTITFDKELQMHK